jgi:hypothetical protein
MRGVGVPLAILVNPISNSLLPEIARLRSLLRIRDAIRLIDARLACARGGCRMRIRALLPRTRHRPALSARQIHG